jgi:hypothetical protein
MAYRLVEAIRNYVQHRELPISGITFHRSKELDSEREVTAFSHWLAPYIDAVEISRERDLDADVAVELERLGTKVNPMPLLRAYIEHVGAVHLEFRALLKEHEAGWERALAEASGQYASHCPGTKLVGLGAGFKHEDGTVSQVENISQDWAEYRKYLRIKHFTAVNFSMRYVKWSE